MRLALASIVLLSACSPEDAAPPDAGLPELTGELTLWGTAADDRALEIALAADGTRYVAGTTTGAFPGSTSQGGVDAFVTRISASGELVWTRQLGSAADDAPIGIFVRDDEVIVVVDVPGPSTIHRLAIADGTPVTAAVEVVDAAHVDHDVDDVALDDDGTLWMTGSYEMVDEKFPDESYQQTWVGRAQLDGVVTAAWGETALEFCASRFRGESIARTPEGVVIGGYFECRLSNDPDGGFARILSEALEPMPWIGTGRSSSVAAPGGAAHYTSHGGGAADACCSARITQVGGWTADIAVPESTGMSIRLARSDDRVVGYGRGFDIEGDGRSTRIVAVEVSAAGEVGEVVTLLDDANLDGARLAEVVVAGDALHGVGDATGDAVLLTRPWP